MQDNITDCLLVIVSNRLFTFAFIKLWKFSESYDIISRYMCSGA